MSDRPALSLSSGSRRNRRGRRRVGLALIVLCVVAIAWIAVLVALWTYSWLRLPADEFRALDEEVAALGVDAPRAPSASSTALIVLTDERDPVSPRPAELRGPVVLLQYGGPRTRPAALALPERLEVSADGQGSLPLSELQRKEGLDALARAVIDYTEVRVDHVVGVSIDVLPRLVEILGPVEVCGDQGCRTSGIEEVRAAIAGAEGEAFVDVVADHVRAVSDEMTPRWVASSPWQAQQVIELLGSQLTTDRSLRGTALLDVIESIADAPSVDAEVVPLLVDDDSDELIPVPEPAVMRFQHLRDGTAFSASDPDEDDLAADVVEAVSVAVLNGAGVDGLASRIEAELTADGFNVVGAGNADSFEEGVTVVQYADGDNATAFAASKIADALGDVRREGLAAPPMFEEEPVDVLITLGEDLVE